MKVVLLNNIRGIGRVGDIKDVSDGYARNFLFPQGLGRPATQGALKDADAMKSKRLEASALAQTEAQQVAQRIEGAAIVIPAKANKQGKLFAGVEAAQIAEMLSAKAGAHITAAQVQLEAPIKAVGEHPVSVELIDGVTANVVVSVTAQ